MCLSTAYFNEKNDDQIAARYVAEVRVEAGRVILTDVMGTELAIEGSVQYIDLTGGTVIVKTAD